MNGASVCDIPLEGKEFNVNKIKWNPDGRSILVQDKNNLVIAYPHFTFLQEAEQEDEYEDDRVNE